MPGKRRKRAVIYLLGLLLALAAVPAWLFYAQVRQDRLDRALIAAIKRNDTSAVLSLLNQGADANARDLPDLRLSPWQLILMRLRGQRVSVPDALPALLVQLEVRESADGEFIHLPENVTITRALLEHGANPDGRDTESGWSPLRFAVGYNYADTVQLLLAHRADVNIRDAEQDTPLHGVRDDMPGANAGIIQKILLEHGADVNARNNEGWTPLTALCIGEPHDISLATALLQHGADVDAVDADGDTPLRLAAAFSGDGKLLLLLLQSGADVNGKTAGGYTPLMAAVREGNVENVKILLKWGAQVNVRCGNEFTALELAEEYERKTIITLLKQAGAR